MCVCMTVYDSLLRMFYHFIMKLKLQVVVNRRTKNATRYLGIT